MSDISAKTFVIMWEAAGAHGIDTASLVPELPFPVAPLHRPFARMRWDDYAAAVGVLERHGCGPADFEAIGRHIVRVPSYRFMRRVAGSLVEPLHLYWTAYRWLRPLMFPNLASEQYQTDDARLILEFSIPEPYAACPGFMYMVKGSAAAMPTILDLPPAEVSGDITPRHALLAIHPPPAPSRAWRLGRMARSLLSPMALVDELGRQQEEIQRSWESLDRTRRDMQELIERIPDAVIVHRDGLVLYANPALARLLDLAPGQIAGTAVLDHIHTDDRAVAGRHLLDTQPEDRDAMSRTVRVVRRDGDSATLELSPAQHISFEGRPAVLAVGRDVSERWRMNEQLARTDRMSSLGRLAAGVAHELNNPLAYIELNLHLLARHIETIATATPRRRAEQSLEAARHGVERARTIVRDLGTFSRPELDTVELLDVHPLIDAAEAMLSKQVAHRARVERDYQATLQVMANRARLEQVFLNLLLNAAQAFAADDPEHNWIVVRTREGGDSRLTIEIEDNGAGIEPAHQARVFDPFFTTKPVGEGTGLGLAICHGIVSRLGGAIALRSQPGEGTTFSVTLPATRRSDRPAPPVQPPAPVVGLTNRRGRVLIIDDEPALARALKGLIEDTHDAELTTSGREALSILADREFDVVFCDLMMVDLSGMDLFEELERTLPDVAERVVFMTGGAFTRQAREFLERVPNRCLDKPFRLSTVLTLIDECLAGQEAASAS